MFIIPIYLFSEIFPVHQGPFTSLAATGLYFTTGCTTGCKNSTCLIYEIRRTTNSACRVEVRIVYTLQPVIQPGWTMQMSLARRRLSGPARTLWRHCVTARRQCGWTVNRWRTVVSWTWKYDEPEVENVTRVCHMFCRMANYKNLEL